MHSLPGEPTHVYKENVGGAVLKPLYIHPRGQTCREELTEGQGAAPPTLRAQARRAAPTVPTMGSPTPTVMILQK